MTTRGMRRSAGPLLLSVLSVLLLSGCFTLRMDLDIQADNTIDGGMVLAVDKSLAGLMGGEDAVEDALTDGGPSFQDQPSAGSVDVKPYRTDELVGVEYTFDGIPIEEFSSDAMGPDSLSITRDGDRFVIEGTLDFTSDGLDSDEIDAGAMMQGADVTVSISFPGKVISANGDIDGNTVTWTPTVGERTTISAVGSAETGLPWVLILGVALVVLLVVLAVVAVVMSRGRRSASPSGGPLPEGSIVPGAPVESGAGSAEPADSTQPTQVIPTGQQPTQVLDLPPEEPGR